MKARSGFMLALSLSLLIHGGLISFVPPPRAPEALARRPLHEVELRRVEIPIPEAPPPKPEEVTPPVPSPALEEAPLGVVTAPPGPPGSGLTDQELALSGALPPLEGSIPPPALTVQNPGASTILLPPPGEGLGPPLPPKGVPWGKDLRGVLPSLKPEEALLARLDREGEKARHTLIQKELERTREKKTPPFDIRGPAAEREVVFRPSALSVPSPAEGEIELKFWVLPDGTVGRVIPLTRGDTALEALATGHLKQWKFNPLRSELQTGEQWGTIVFRFIRR